MSRPRLRAALAALTLALAVGGCTDGGSDAEPTSATTTTATPTPPPEPDPAPRAGECHRMSWAAAVSPVPTGETVACRRPHTTRTFFVGSLGLAEGQGVDDDAVQDRVARTCTRRFEAHVGASARELRLTMLETLWFTPSLEQADLGADWFRCDVVAVAADETLMRLPRRTKGLASTVDVAMCGTTEPGRAAFRRVACARTHAWRAVASVDLKGDAFPSAQAARAAMEVPCRDAAMEASDDPLTFRWSEERPTRAQWRAGQRYGLCWVPTP